MSEEVLRATIARIMEMIEGLPGGIDYTASPSDESPDDMAAHIGGLIYQECKKALS